jgi:basic amino acid/polyamine antiporter, APA family
MVRKGKQGKDLFEGIVEICMTEKNQISIAAATAVGLGAIIGAGIFALSGSAIAYAGAEALIAFVLVGIVVIMIALQTGELGSILPRVKGGPYSYVFSAFGSELGFITGIIYYFSIATSVSTITLSFGAYFISTVFQISNAATITSLERIPAIVLIAFLTIINLLGIKKAVRADYLFVITKVVILLIFIGFAVYFAFLSGGSSLSNFTSSSLGATGTQGGIAGIFLACTAIIFAYSGFQVISTFTSRVKEGAKGAAKAIIASVLISIILYVSVIVALLLLRPASTFTVSGDPLVSALYAVRAPTLLVILVGLGALVATTSASLALLLGASRTLFQISNDGLLPGTLRKFDKKKDVAYNGVLVTAAIAVITLFAGNVYIIAAISNFGLLFSWLMTSLAVIHFRRRYQRPIEFKSPFFPYLPILSIIAVLIFLATLPSPSLALGTVMILSLIILYYAQREIEDKKVIRVRLFK